MKILPGLVILALAFSACKQKKSDSSEALEFIEIQPKGDPITEAGISLTSLQASVPSINRANYVVTRTQFVSEDRRAANSNAINIEFPSLTKSACESIRTVYGNISKIVCKDGKYSLQDFLFPTIQATLNKKFANENIVTPIDRFRNNTDALQNNCWSTTFEVQRKASDAFYLFQMNGVEAKRVILAESTNIAGSTTAAPSETEVRSMLGKAKFGDMILIYFNLDMAKEGGRAMGELIHAATIIDSGGIAFERTGWDKNFAMRFVTFDDIIAQYAPKPGSFSWEIRRMNKPFPAPGEIIKDWSYGGELKGIFQCAKIPYKYDGAGRASLPTDAFKLLRQSSYMSKDCR